MHGKRFEFGRIHGNPRGPVDPEGLVEPWDEEDDTDLRVGQDVLQRVELVVAGPVRNEKGGVVDDFHEAGRIPLGRGVTMGRENKKWAERDEAAPMFVEFLKFELEDGFLWLLVGLAKLGFRFDKCGRHDLVLLVSPMVDRLSSLEPRRKSTSRISVCLNRWWLKGL